MKNNLNPDFVTSFTVPYYFEKMQEMRFVMIDGDGGSDYDEIGEIVTSMGQIMGARAQMYQANLTHHGNANRGQIIVRSEAVQQSNEAVKIALQIQNANNVAGGCMGMCAEPVNYRLQIQKQVGDSDNFAACYTHSQVLRASNTSVP